LTRQFLWVMGQQSPALDRRFSVVGKTAGAGGQDTAAGQHGNGEIHC